MKRTVKRVAGALAWMVVACLGLPGAAHPQATPYVPVGDPAYRDLDLLVARGMAGPLILGERPYSRMAFARAVKEARAAAAAGGRSVKPRVEEAMSRLEARFGAELSKLCPGDAGACAAPRGRVSVRSLSADATAADSPARPIPWQLKSELDADVNPLLQRNQGRVLADGWTLGTELWVDGVLGPRLAAQIVPRAWVEEGGGSRADATLLEGYVRALLGNLSVEVGRDARRHGHAREVAPALSSNPRGLDMVRLSMERPARLPWIFRGLGPAGFSALVADMGREQDTPGSKLVVLEGAVHPHPNLELGGALLNHQGGGVGPEASFGERVLDALFILPRRPFYFLSDVHVASDKAAALDARLTLPGAGLDVFVEALTTDDHDLFSAVSQALWNDAAWTVGARATGLGREGRWDVWAEASRVGLLPYTHQEFTSGLTLDRRVLGSPLGPLGTGFVGGVDRVGARGTLSGELAWERYSGDRYRNPDDGHSWRFKVADNPDEIRVRCVAEWAAHARRSGVSTGVRLGWERVTRYALGPASRTNLMAQVRASYSW